ncbi:MAG: alcohol dehydrogenase catalytic domain-containing protein [Gemmatimonadaceae bacterium]|nr:alcohol dehydrogenase catalytic domain-containing protein [Gemmatimonadaceae bacterium]
MSAHGATTMRAAVLVDVNRLEVRDVPRIDPSPHEVLVKVEAVGLCGTDVHIVEGHANYNADERGRLRSLRESPQVLGHEIAGVVAECGSAVRDLAPGDRVIVDQGRSCVSEWRTPRCEYCASGDSHQCEWYREHGITGLLGGFADFVTVPAVNAVRLRTALPADQAALTEPLGCVIHAADLMARASARYALGARGDHRVRTIIICGGGPAGILFVQYLRRVAGFDGQVLVSEPSALRRALVERFGAEAIDPTTSDLVSEVANRTAGRRAELLIEASGAGPVFAMIPGLVRKQATVLLYGHGHAGVDLSVMNQVQFLEPTLVSPVGASGGHAADGRPLTYARALQLLEDGVIDVAPIVSHRYASLEALPDVFAGAYKRPDFVKGVLTL